jgi:DNA replication protein DnaC
MSDEDAQAAVAEHREALTALSRAMWRSVVPPRFWDASLEDLDPVLDDLAAWARSDARSNIVLIGPVGSGKTHAAVAAARERHLRGESVLFGQVARLLDQLRPDGGVSIEELYSVDVLILDDLAGEKPTDWTKERLGSIVNDRWIQTRPIIVTTNLPLTALSQVLDDRLYSRLIDDAVVLRVSGRDRRRA